MADPVRGRLTPAPSDPRPCPGNATASPAALQSRLEGGVATPLPDNTHTQSGMMKHSHLHTWPCLCSFNSGKGRLVGSQSSLPPPLTAHGDISVCVCVWGDVPGFFFWLSGSLVGKSQPGVCDKSFVAEQRFSTFAWLRPQTERLSSPGLTAVHSYHCQRKLCKSPILVYMHLHKRDKKILIRARN